MDIKEVGKGAIPDPKDDRDYIYEALGTSSDVKWDEGFDIEEKLGYKLKPKNQHFSYSCVGQAYAIYKAVKRNINPDYNEVSAKSIYSLIALGNNQGAYLRDGADTLKIAGALTELKLPSFNKEGIATEEHLTDKTWFTEQARKEMLVLRVNDYFRVTTWNIDGFAKAIRDGDGMVAGVVGNNNGTWLTTYPKPPINAPQGETWGHALYFGKFRIRDGKKEIGCLNSWGNIGENGWQWLGEEWFAENGRYLFSPWVLIYTNNINNMTNDSAKILKDKNSSAVGIWLPAISEDVLKSYCLNMGITVPYKESGEIDWEKLIQGNFELK